MGGVGARSCDMKSLGSKVENVQPILRKDPRLYLANLLRRDWLGPKC